MENFSVELHSSASSKLYPQKTNAYLTNFLTNQINLKGGWEVALTEIWLPLEVFQYQGRKFWDKCHKSREIYRFRKHQPSPSYYPTKSLLSPQCSQRYWFARISATSIEWNPKLLIFQLIPLVNESLSKRCLV